MTTKAQHAITQYRKDLAKALAHAPENVRTAALDDAAEFLADAANAMDAGRLASLSAAYDRFVEQFGTPDQLAASYLEQSAIDPSESQTPRLTCSSSPSEAWGQWVAFFLISAALVAGMGRASSGEPPKLSPFTDVEFESETVIVTVDGEEYEWLGLDGKPVPDILDSARKQFGKRWQKRVAEDLVEVLWGMDHRPGERVTLRLRSIGSEEDVVFTAKMSTVNRQLIYVKRNRQEIEALRREGEASAITPPKLSPFTDVTFKNDEVIVTRKNKTCRWEAIDGIGVLEIVAFSRKQYGDRWQKRIAEDLIEVLWGMGHKPEVDVELRLVDTDTNEELAVTARMTESNRKAIWNRRRNAN